MLIRDNLDCNNLERIFPLVDALNDIMLRQRPDFGDLLFIHLFDGSADENDPTAAAAGHNTTCKGSVCVIGWDVKKERDAYCTCVRVGG